MKFETNLSNKDKMTIALVLFVGLAFLAGWYGVRPQITTYLNTQEEINKAEAKQNENKNKIISLSTAETAYSRAVSDLADSTSYFYPVMRSSEIDRMATSYVLSFGLYPEGLNINMPDGAVEESPYIYSEAYLNGQTRITPAPTPVSIATPTGSSALNTAVVESIFTPYSNARETAASTAASGVQCARLTLIMTGDQSTCQALIDDLCTKPSLRITGFDWEAVDSVERLNEETGQMERVETDLVRLKVYINFYMADIADYEAAVAQAVEEAGG
ncbi:MAG: hypothetical protein J5685_09350 [Clostridiales bacterium]|nr:hypothetical protein [Clostridiales bacterium]